MSEAGNSNSVMPFQFDRAKAVQAAAFLLKTRPSRTDNYMRLLKILYVADRESLQETGTPITGDKFVSMKHGTMLTKLLDLAKKKESRAYPDPQNHEYWDEYIARDGSFDIRLLSDPGVGALCEYEIRKLQEVAERFKDYNQFDMGKYTHELPEYNDPGAGSEPISFNRLLEVLGLSDAADAIVDEAVESAAIKALLGGA